MITLLQKKWKLQITTDVKFCADQTFNRYSVNS